MPPCPVRSPVGGAGEAWLSGDYFCLLCFFSVRSPVSALRSRIAPPEGKERKKALPIPQTPPPRHARDHRAVFIPALGLLPRPGARRAGSVPPALSEKSAFSSDPVKGTCLGSLSRWTRLGRPSPPCDRPMRVALAGFPSPRPDFWGGKPERVLCPLRPAPPRSESGEEPRGAKESVS